MRKAIFATLVILCVLVVAIPAIADSGIGRYQAINFGPGGALIIDTKDGHFWVWAVEYGQSALFYCGKVKPGKKIMEVIYELKKPEPKSK